VFEIHKICVFKRLLQRNDLEVLFKMMISFAIDLPI